MPGSEGPAAYPKFIIKHGHEEYKQSTCFLPEVSHELQYYMELFSFYKNGHLFNGGGVSGQPIIYLELMNLIDAVINGE